MLALTCLATVPARAQEGLTLDEVLRTTLDRFGAAGVQPAALEVLADVDTVDDLPPGWLERASGDGAD